MKYRVEQATWIAGADRASEDVRRAMSGERAYWPGSPNSSVRLPDDPALRKDWLNGYSANMQALLAEYVIEPAKTE